MPIYLIAGVGVLSVLMIWLGMRGGKSKTNEIDDRLNNYAGMKPISLQEAEMKEGFSKRVLSPLIKRWSVALGQKSPAAATERVRLKLAQAGNPNGLGPMEFMGLRYLLAIGFGGGVAALMFVSGVGMTNTLLIGAVLAALRLYDAGDLGRPEDQGASQGHSQIAPGCN